MVTNLKQSAPQSVEKPFFISEILRKYWLPIVFLLPAAFFLVAFIAIPMGQAILLSFQRWNGIEDATWVGLRNFRLLLQDDLFWQSLSHVGYYTVATVIFNATIPLIIASLLNSGIYGSTVFRFLYFMPVIISLAITGMLWRAILEPNFGILNEMLRDVGLESWTRLWLADKNLALPSIIVVSVWQSFGFFVVIYFAAMQTIPQELYESASIDGANAWHRFRFITVPMLRSTITVTIVLTTIGGIKVFDQVWVMTTGGPNHASETLGTYLYRVAFGAGGSSNPQYGYATAIALLILVLSLIFSIIQIRLGRVGEVEL
ncbi:MAG: sugar ABC transporter permease [Aggregatilineales bacterium]